MADGLDVEELRRQLETQFQVSFVCRRETVDGGDFDTIRPFSMEVGNSFAVLLSRTHRQFEASFRADNFAGALLRQMSEGDHAAKSLFRGLREIAEKSGSHIHVAINSDAGPDNVDQTDRWTKVEIEVSRRLPSGSGPADLLAMALSVSSTCMVLALALVGTEDAGLTAVNNSVAGLPEGSMVKVQVNRYERSPANRVACIGHYGPRCQSCSFDFGHFYGPLGEGYIEVHHRTPVSCMGPDYLVDPVLDLVPLCANCHAAVHRTDPPMQVDELKRMIEQRRAGLLK